MSKEAYAREVLRAGRDLGITPRGIVIAFATVSVECDWIMYANAKVPESLNLPHERVGSDGKSVGLFQQQVVWGNGAWWWGDAATCMDPYKSARLFFERLKKLDYNGPNSPGSYAQAVQGSAFPDRYDTRMAEAQQLYNQLSGGPVTWTGDPVWLEEVLRPALGGRLKTLPGWQNSGHGDFKDIRGIMVHHTGNSRESAQSIRDGRPDLPGPLSNLHIAPNGDVTIVAVGVCWHAGRGSYPWLPTDNANQHMIGIECAWPTVTNGKYDPNERWPDAQIISMRDTCAALAVKLGHPATRVIGHKEWAGASQGKWDPGNIDMGWFRGEVAKDMRGEFDKTSPPPAQPGPVLPPDYAKETWDQLRIKWPQLGDRTLVDTVAALGEKLGVEGCYDVRKPQ